MSAYESLSRYVFGFEDFYRREKLATDVKIEVLTKLVGFIFHTIKVPKEAIIELGVLNLEDWAERNLKITSGFDEEERGIIKGAIKEVIGGVAQEMACRSPASVDQKAPPSEKEDQDVPMHP
jgi:hypothetical protein